MPFDAILLEVERLHHVSERLAKLAEKQSACVRGAHDHLGSILNTRHSFGSPGRDKK